MTEIRIGALCWNQYTDWPSLLEAGIRADKLGYDSLWTWGQLQPSTSTVVGDRLGVEARFHDRQPLTDR